MYYWSDAFRNNTGETLETCLQKYGSAKDYCPVKDMGIQVVFLDDRKTFSNSFLTKCTRGQVDWGVWAKVKLQSEDPDVYVKRGSLN